MDQTNTEPTLEESIHTVMQTLPTPVREYLAKRKHSMVVADLMKRYSLHVDQAAELETQLMLLLMGIASPAEFSAALLSEASIPESSVSGILEDVNKMVFIPLREEMRRATSGTEPATASAAAAEPETGPAVQPQTAAPQKPTVEQGTYAPAPQGVPTPQPPAPSIVLPPTNPSDALLQEDTAPLPPRHVLPGAPGLRNLIEHPPLPTRGAPPPENLPGAAPAFIDLHPPVPAPVAPEPAHLPPIPPRAAPPQSAPLESAPPYSVDPYREPVE